MKQRNKFSISKKLFLITFGLIFTVLICSMLFQNLFFEEFYLNKKIKDMTREINKFSELYSYNISDEKNLIEELFRFEQQNNSKVAIFSKDGQLKYLTNYYNNTDDFKTLTSFCTELLNDKYLINKVITSGKTETTVFENKYSNTTKIGSVGAMSLNSENDSLIVAVSSMQPINEASAVIQEFYFYLFLGFSIIGIFLSSIYANLISKPLVNINKVAKKMSSMDFTVRCEEISDDEIGNLATTLNFLSSTLKNALDDLKLKNKKLEEDIEKERKLEEMRKDFVASVSHDLKTPIGIIEGYAEGLKDGIATGKDALFYIETIIDESHKMNKLVTNMLELSKLESGNLELVMERFNILRLIRKLIKSFQLEFELKNLNLILNTNLEYCYVIGDIFQLEQVLTNLISNALKYTPKDNDVIIEVNSINNIITISIENKGVHIPEEEIDNLYNKFYRIDKARNSSNNSNGLGLSIVKRILTLHESSYILSNTENGVKFEFTLKKANDEEIYD
ncbi:sensor histidine kinase [Clostridium gallinarum]|nr:HAMP domain-containing sensor histidine kinase [Clostridium gallinarum]